MYLHMYVLLNDYSAAGAAETRDAATGLGAS